MPPRPSGCAVRPGWETSWPDPEVGTWLQDFSMIEEQLTGLESQITKAGKGKEQGAVRIWLERNPGPVDRSAPVAGSRHEDQAAG